MTAAEFLALLVKRMSRWVTLDLERVAFVDDDKIEYQVPSRALTRRTDLFTPADARTLDSYLSGDHSWVHANLLRTSDGTYVVSLRRGPDTGRRDAGIGAPFALNVSKEPSPLEVVD